MVAIHGIKDCFFVFGGTCIDSWNGELVWSVSHLHWEFRCWLSTVLGFPFFFFFFFFSNNHSTAPISRVTNWYGGVIPLLKLSQRAFFSFSFLWYGTGIGLCLALGVAPSLRQMWAGGGQTLLGTFHYYWILW